ncbi:Cytochrome P450, partial [Dillenia turbinata]
TLLNASMAISTVTIEWAMPLLLNHPNVLNRARAKMDDHIGQQHLVDEPDLSKLQYLLVIINETLRSFPATLRESSEDCTIGGGGGDLTCHVLGRVKKLGSGFVHRVVGFALAALSRCFDWERVSDEEVDMSKETRPSMPKAKPLEVMCKARKSMTNILFEL